MGAGSPRPRTRAMPPGMEPEEYRRAIAKHDYEDYKAEVAERLKLQAEFAHAALKGLTFANGGAIVALFTFIGNSEAQVERSDLWWAFALFGLGLASTLVAYVSGFFSQGFYMQATQEQAWNAQEDMLGGQGSRDFKVNYRRGELIEYLGVGAAISSVIAFIIGAGFALSGVVS